MNYDSTLMSKYTDNNTIPKSIGPQDENDGMGYRNNPHMYRRYTPASSGVVNVSPTLHLFKANLINK